MSELENLFRYKVRVQDSWYQLVLIMLKKIKLSENSKILEVGCGIGGFCSWLLRQSWNVTGLDIYREAIEVASIRSSAHFILGDGRYLPFKSESYDLVICSETLEHTGIFYPKVFNELVRVTKIGGHISITVPNILRLFPIDILIDTHWKQQHFKDYGQKTEEYPFYFFRLMQLFEREDLEVMAKLGVGSFHIPFLDRRLKEGKMWIPRFFKWVEKKLDTIYFLGAHIGVLAKRIRAS